jgi:hypothetical protein
MQVHRTGYEIALRIRNVFAKEISGAQSKEGGGSITDATYKDA